MKKILSIISLILCVTLSKGQNLSMFMTNYTATAVMATGSWDSLTSGSVSAQSAMTINFSQFYNQYNYFFLLFSVSPGTDNTNLLMLISADGSTFPTGGSDYNWNLNYGSGSSAGQPDAAIHLMNNVGSTSGYHSDGFIIFQNPDVSAQRGVVRWDLAQTDISGGNAPISGAGSRNGNAVMQAFQMLFSSGTITGSWKLLGSR